jgi:ATP-dependent exoDNAse (exonuclease V) alpha subunit
VAIFVADHPHLDYGYAVTSHSSQGQTADRVLVQVDTERGGEQLVNRRLAYVAVSRGRFDAQIYTDDKARLGDSLSREVAHRSAIESSRAPVAGAQTLEPSLGGRQEVPLVIAR